MDISIQKQLLKILCQGEEAARRHSPRCEHCGPLVHGHKHQRRCELLQSIAQLLRSIHDVEHKQSKLSVMVIMEGDEVRCASCNLGLEPGDEVIGIELGHDHHHDPLLCSACVARAQSLLDGSIPTLLASDAWESILNSFKDSLSISWVTLDDVEKYEAAKARARVENIED